MLRRSVFVLGVSSVLRHSGNDHSNLIPCANAAQHQPSLGSRPASPHLPHWSSGSSLCTGNALGVAGGGSKTRNVTAFLPSRPVGAEREHHTTKDRICTAATLPEVSPLTFEEESDTEHRAHVGVNGDSSQTEFDSLPHHSDGLPHNLVEDVTDQRLELTFEQQSKDILKKNVKGGPLKVLFLSSDTGGGHRASAESLAKQFLRHYPGTTYDLLDIWTEDGCLPYRTIVPSYQHLSKHPRQWRVLYHVSNQRWYEWIVDKHSVAMCERKIRDRITSYNPDVVVSVHPAMNHAPIKSVRKISKKMGKHIPFFTVVTDYGAGHCTWFQKDTEKCYIASERIASLARKRGQIPEKNLIMFGLPIRQDFDAQATAMGDRTTEMGRRYQRKVRHDLGLDPHVKTVLVMGGGEGVGSLSEIVNELFVTFTKRGIDATIAVVCGRNEELRKDLRVRDWDAVISESEKPRKRLKGLFMLKKLMPSRRIRRRLQSHLDRKEMRRARRSTEQGNVKVVGLGFVTNMAEFMVAADVLVSKAGPGTIAEAAAVGLPVMLTSFLPGQEAGNVDVVLDGEFGAYCKDPEGIADEVSTWLEDEELLQELSCNAQKEGHPHAAADIVIDIGERTHRWMEINENA